MSLNNSKTYKLSEWTVCERPGLCRQLDRQQVLRRLQCLLTQQLEGREVNPLTRLRIRFWTGGPGNSGDRESFMVRQLWPLWHDSCAISAHRDKRQRLLPSKLPQLTDTLWVTRRRRLRATAAWYHAYRFRTGNLASQSQSVLTDDLCLPPQQTHVMFLQYLHLPDSVVARLNCYSQTHISVVWVGAGWRRACWAWWQTLTDTVCQAPMAGYSSWPSDIDKQRVINFKRPLIRVGGAACLCRKGHRASGSRTVFSKYSIGLLYFLYSGVFFPTLNNVNKQLFWWVLLTRLTRYTVHGTPSWKGNAPLSVTISVFVFLSLSLSISLYLSEILQKTRTEDANESSSQSRDLCLWGCNGYSHMEAIVTVGTAGLHLKCWNA